MHSMFLPLRFVARQEWYDNLPNVVVLDPEMETSYIQVGMGRRPRADVGCTIPKHQPLRGAMKYIILLGKTNFDKITH